MGEQRNRQAFRLSFLSSDAEVFDPKASEVLALRIGDVRVFYDVTGQNVEVLAIVSKAEAATWLAKHGKSEEK